MCDVDVPETPQGAGWQIFQGPAICSHNIHGNNRLCHNSSEAVTLPWRISNRRAARRLHHEPRPRDSRQHNRAVVLEAMRVLDDLLQGGGPMPTHRNSNAGHRTGFRGCRLPSISAPRRGRGEPKRKMTSSAENSKSKPRQSQVSSHACWQRHLHATREAHISQGLLQHCRATSTTRTKVYPGRATNTAVELTNRQIIFPLCMIFFMECGK